MKTNDFPVHSLIPIGATAMNSPLEGLALEVEFEPFEFQAETIDGQETFIFDQPLCADDVNLPSSNIADLTNTVVDFPLNPDEGYIDASVYFGSVHNPVDISKITFGKIIDQTIEITVEARWMFAFERTGFNDVPHVFSTHLTL